MNQYFLQKQNFIFLQKMNNYQESIKIAIWHEKIEKNIKEKAWDCSPCRGTYNSASDLLLYWHAFNQTSKHVDTFYITMQLNPNQSNWRSVSQTVLLSITKKVIILYPSIGQVGRHMIDRMARWQKEKWQLTKKNFN